MERDHAVHAVAFLQDLATVMLVAGAVTVLFHRLRQPVVLGYIVAGVIIGPHTPPYQLVHSRETIHVLAELGVVFLMFSLGLEFSLRKLQRVGATAFIAALLEIAVLIAAGYGIGRAFGWSLMDSVFLGALISISSTTIIIKALAELGKTKEGFAQIIFGILIVEDLLGILLIALLSGIALTGTLAPLEVLEAAGRLAEFLVVALVLGLLVVPRLLRYVARFHSDEMLLVTVLALCFGGSLLAVQLGYSVALGAFTIGAVVAESRDLGRIEHLTAPIRDLFAAVFFVAIGMLIDPKLLLEYAVPITVITLAVVAGKVTTCTAGTLLAGHDTRTSLLVGMGLAQIGEFSFIIASLGETLRVTSAYLYPVAVAVSAVTTLLTPYLIRSAPRAAERLDRILPAPVAGGLELYRGWVARLGEALERNVARRLVWRMLSVMLVNLLLIAAAFIAAGFVARFLPPDYDALRWIGGRRGLVWFGTLLLAVPLYVATLRKLQALAMFLAELTLGHRAVGEGPATGQAVVRHVIMAVGVVVLALATMVVSAALLPPVTVGAGMLAVAVAAAVLLWRPSIRIYSRAQIALREVLTRPLTERHEDPAVLRSFLREAQVELVSLDAAAPASGRLIRELELRSRTGASVVGIDRGEDTVVNPGPDEELQPGDSVLLLGSSAQCAAAHRLLTGRDREGEGATGKARP
jgi:monovalent cation:H+ antiporter-2, CPA2 family